MSFKIYLIMISCLFFIHMSSKAGSLECKSFYKEMPVVSLYLSSKTNISTPESLPTVELAVKKLDDLIQDANSNNGVKSKIYREALPLLYDLKKEAQKIIQMDARSQDDVFSFFYKFSQVIDLPKTYADKIGEFADGFDFITEFTEQAYQERLESFLTKYLSPEPLLKQLILKIGEGSKFALSKTYKYISIDRVDLPDNIQVPFEYKYIFKAGPLSLLSLFKDRETGKAFLGVSFSEVAPFDGHPGHATSFLAHGHLHAYTQKYFDSLLFQELGADTIEKQVRLKEKTNSLLQSRIFEYQKNADPKFRLAIEAVLFTFLREQCRTYPIGVANFYKDPAQIEAFKKIIYSATSGGRFGEEYKVISQNLIGRAFDWVRERVNFDANNLHAFMESSQKEEKK